MSGIVVVTHLMLEMISKKFSCGGRKEEVGVLAWNQNHARLYLAAARPAKYDHLDVFPDAHCEHPNALLSGLK